MLPFGNRCGGENSICINRDNQITAAAIFLKCGIKRTGFSMAVVNCTVDNDIAPFTQNMLFSTGGQAGR